MFSEFKQTGFNGFVQAGRSFLLHLGVFLRLLIGKGHTQAHSVKSPLHGSNRFLFRGQRLLVSTLHDFDFVFKKTLEEGTQIAAPKLKKVIPALVHPGPASSPVNPNIEPHIGIVPVFGLQPGVPELQTTTPFVQTGVLELDPLLELLDEEDDDEELTAPELEEDELLDEELEEDELDVAQATEPGKKALEVKQPGTIPSTGTNLQTAEPVKLFVQTGVPELHIILLPTQNGLLPPLDEELLLDEEDEDEELTAPELEEDELLDEELEEDELDVAQATEPGKKALEVKQPGTIPSTGIDLQTAEPISPPVHAGVPEAHIIFVPVQVGETEKAGKKLCEINI